MLMKIKKILNKFGYDIKKYHPIYETTIKPLGIKTIIDIGANEGCFAKEMRRMFPDAFIYSFEPLQDCHKTLVSTMSGDTNFKAYNVALGEEKGVVDMQKSSFHPSSSMLTMTNLHKSLYPKSKDISIEKIKIERMDKIFGSEEYKEKIMIKIDVQGFEDKVISGGKETIKKAAVAIIETSFVALYENQPLFSDINQLMQNLGFSYYGDLHKHYSGITGKLIYEDSIFINKGKISI